MVNNAPKTAKTTNIGILILAAVIRSASTYLT